MQLVINAKDNSYFKKLSKELSIQWTNELSHDLTEINCLKEHKLKDNNLTDTTIEVIIYDYFFYLGVILNEIFYKDEQLTQCAVEIEELNT